MSYIRGLAILATALTLGVAAMPTPSATAASTVDFHCGSEFVTFPTRSKHYFGVTIRKKDISFIEINKEEGELEYKVWKKVESQWDTFYRRKLDKWGYLYVSEETALRIIDCLD